MKNTIKITLLLSLVAFTQAAITVNPWNPIYKGVWHATGEADANEPRIQKVNALRIDLQDPDVEFYTTPSNGESSLETASQHCSDFLVENGLQVAVNANFFNPACDWGNAGERDLEGLAICQGDIVSPQEGDPRGNSLLITQDNVASFGHTPFDTTGIYNAVTGDIWLLSNGVNLQAGGGGDAHPRTVMGISQNGRYLYMLVIDGRQSGYSDGATLDEATQWLIRFGAYNGINFDGGGSTVMTKSDAGAGYDILNSPMGSGWFCNNSGQRYNGNHIGVWAQPAIPAEINVKQTQNNISIGDNFDFGNCEIGVNLAVSFTIENQGSFDLALTGSPKIQISGTGASEFNVSSQPTSPVVGNGSTVFEITFSPTSNDLLNAQVSIASNDSDENPYTFSISGMGFSYDATKREDIVVFNLATGIWSGSHNQPAPDFLTGDVATESSSFGNSGDIPLIGDVNGDGLDDIIIVQSAIDYDWFASHSTDSNKDGKGEFLGVVSDSSLDGFGTVLASQGCFLADITGDEILDAVTVDSGFFWSCAPSGVNGLGTGTPISGPSQWGLAGDIPLIGDFNGDGLKDISVWRAAGGVDWFVRLTTASGIGTGAMHTTGDFGVAGDIPMVGDVNGDGRDDGIIVRPSGANFIWIAGFADASGYIDYNNGGGHNGFVTFGLTTDIPVVADINGDGRVDIGYVRDDGEGEFLWNFALTSTQGDFSSDIFAQATFGGSDAIPLIGQLDYVIAGDVNSDFCVDLADFSRMAAAWLSIVDEPNWDSDCDISSPNDGEIDFLDLTILADNWLAGV